MRSGRIMTTAAVVVAAALLTGCTGSSAPKPSPTSTDARMSAKEVSDRIAAEKPSTDSIAHVTGTLAGSGVPVRIDVEEIRALKDSTLLRWRLSTTSGSKQQVTTFQFAVEPNYDTRNVALVADGGRTTLRPYTYRYQNVSGQGSSCLCGSPGPDADGTGQQLYALMPALPAGTRSVDLSFPGFSPMKDVPVSR